MPTSALETAPLPTESGEDLIALLRRARRHSYLTKDGELRIHRDPIFDEETRVLQERISMENKRLIAKELGCKVRDIKRIVAAMPPLDLINDATYANLSARNGSI